MPQEGYLVISDITGYTAYLSGTEQEHAEDILIELFEILLEHTVPPLVVSKLEGDAILSYAPQGSFTEGQSLLEVIENIYAQFRQARENMHRHTSCECDACQNTPNLDLKFFVHHGKYSLLDIGGREELSGTDVILIHRLLKNNVTVPAYALYTKAAVDEMGMSDYCDQEMQPHSESYEHIGDVPAYIQDMHQAWEHYQDRNRVYIGENDGLMFEPGVITISAPSSVVWEYVSQPKTFPQWYTGVQSAIVTNMDKERTKLGTTGHCAHGKQVFTVEIVDLRPFDYVTYKSIVPMPGQAMFGEMCMYFTYQLSELDGVTQLVMRTSELTPQGSKFQEFMFAMMFKMMGKMMKQQIQSDFLKSITTLREVVEREITAESITPSNPVSVSSDDIKVNVQKYIAETGI
jgi:uncharacterized membrane protein